MTLAFCTLALIGLGYAMVVVNRRIEKDRRHEALMNRLYKSGKVTRW